ncbi:ABC transporter ATP-binding protein [Thalassotalea maritima]|uniref:ABC transporter ATP-binding protein n=1 Tax=Thalassotalea maritima TaxID=3242416 RepID=UPI003526E41F
MGKPLLRCQQLSWQVDNKTILSDISIDINTGERVAIIGPNGAGKTSLLKVFAGLITPSDGQIAWQNKVMTQLSAKERAKRIAIVSQQQQALFDLNGLDIVNMGLIPHKTLFSSNTEHDNHQVQQALAQVGLADKQWQPFNTLSGGEQQRLMIAKAIVQNAPLLLLDEPTNHLDVYYQHQILQLAVSLQRTVIMSLHDINLASVYCQRIIVINGGKIVADGSVNEVLNAALLESVFQLPCHLSHHNDRPLVHFVPAGTAIAPESTHHDH